MHALFKLTRNAQCFHGFIQSFKNTITLQVYSGNSGRAMVFTSTKSEANELALNAVLKQVCVYHCVIRSLWATEDA